MKNDREEINRNMLTRIFLKISGDMTFGIIEIVWKCTRLYILKWDENLIQKIREIRFFWFFMINNISKTRWNFKPRTINVRGTNEGEKFPRNLRMDRWQSINYGPGNFEESSPKFPRFWQQRKRLGIWRHQKFEKACRDWHGALGWFNTIFVDYSSLW